MTKSKQGKIEGAPQVIDVQAQRDAKLDRERLKGNKMVRGKFIFHEVPGGNIEFPFRKYKKDGIKRYAFVDGEIYTIPLTVAKHLNENGKYPVHAFTVNAAGKSVSGLGKYVQRFSFHSLDFIDTSDADSLATMGSSQIEL